MGVPIHPTIAVYVAPWWIIRPFSRSTPETIPGAARIRVWPPQNPFGNTSNHFIGQPLAPILVVHRVPSGSAGILAIVGSSVVVVGSGRAVCWYPRASTAQHWVRGIGIARCVRFVRKPITPVAVVMIDAASAPAVVTVIVPGAVRQRQAVCLQPWGYCPAVAAGSGRQF